jgi:hypothetical protein
LGRGFSMPNRNPIDKINSHSHARSLGEIASTIRNTRSGTKAKWTKEQISGPGPEV